VSEVDDAAAAELPPELLYRILQLRSEVFVVEQACVYLDPDGRDLEPGTRQLWLEEGGAVVATARVLDEGEHRRLGRIATAPSHRRRGLAARLVEHVLATTTGPWRLDAQAHLASWYERFGFAVDGPEYDDDGIAHVPMLRPLGG
jgi:ElaA protein